MPVPADPTPSEGDPAAVRTHLGWAVAVTVLCFLPLGLIAVVYGLRANRALVEGRIADAQRAARTARRWVVVTIIVGILVDLAIVGSLLLLGAYST